ncbi:TonB-dependent receptor [Moraxella macacae 0408225]|uniref:TonB-dependent receptor n=1 Tax=Moraxella macacae 0408225 TaxID=1230338 RepID=L2F6V3_9GAMM|nr:TonB-dependent receptor [Moraxella macacae]ELA08615.1 TonB-dependent receptor [Moraxella macacae 0408225]
MKPKTIQSKTIQKTKLTVKHTTLSLVLTMLASQSYADGLGVDSDNSMPIVQLPKITVTATRTATSEKNTIAQTSVINEEDLKRYQGQSVLDVLRHHGGFLVRQYGGDGTAGNVVLRGYDNKRILVLIDGIRYGSISYGGSALSLIPADQIDRIEVLHGASGSALYGSDAMGGVIQIFTKGQHAKQSNASIIVGAGTEKSYKAQGIGQFVKHDTTLSVSAGYEKTEGINAVKNATGVDVDKDGFESKNVSFVAKHRFNEALNVGATGLFAKSVSKIDYDDRQEQQNGALLVFADYEQDNLSGSLKYGQSFDKLNAYKTPTDKTPNTFDTVQKQLNLQLGYHLPAGQVIAGYENLHQALDTGKPKTNQPDSYTVKQRKINSAYVGYLLANDSYDAQLNLRYDQNSQFGNKTTYNLGGAYRIMPNTRIGGSYATGFRAPSMNDLYGYSDSWGGYRGNPNLKAETSNNREVFIENSNAYQTTRLTGYQSNLIDAIVSDYSKSPATTFNQGKMQIKGVNLTSDWQIDKVLFGINYDYQDTKDQNGKGLPFHPHYKGLIYVGYQQPKFDVRLEQQKIGDSDLKGYTLINLSGNYYVNKRLSVNARVNNLTNEDYETYRGYNQKGINAFVTATYKWS